MIFLMTKSSFIDFFNHFHRIFPKTLFWRYLVSFGSFGWDIDPILHARHPVFVLRRYFWTHDLFNNTFFYENVFEVPGWSIRSVVRALNTILSQCPIDMMSICLNLVLKCNSILFWKSSMKNSWRINIFSWQYQFSVCNFKSINLNWFYVHFFTHFHGIFSKILFLKKGSCFETCSFDSFGSEEFELTPLQNEIFKK